MMLYHGFYMLVLILLISSTFSYYSNNHNHHQIHNHHIQYYHHHKNHNNDYSINEIPQTYQQKISSSFLSTSQKLITVSSFIRLLQSSKVNAAITTIDIELLECSDSIVVFKGPKDIILIGTAHISEESANLVRRIVRTIRPDLVMIELDSKRIGKFNDENELKESGFILPVTINNENRITASSSSSSTISSSSSTVSSESISSSSSSSPSALVSSQNKQISGFSSMVSGWASRLGGVILGKALGQLYGSIEKLGFTSGGEFKAAIEEGRAIGANVLLGDRDVEVTLQRLAKAISKTDADSFTRLADRLESFQQEIGLSDIDALIDNKQLAIAAIERLKQRDVLNTELTAVREEVPLVFAALIGERDEYMANSLSNAEGNVAVAVVGMAHMFGIEKFLVEKGYSIAKRNCPTNPKVT